MKTIPSNYIVHGTMALAMSVAVITLAWSIIAAIYVYPSTCTVVAYHEKPYKVPVSDKPWDGETDAVRIKVCIFEEMYARDIKCGVVHDGALDSIYRDYYAVGTLLECETAPWRIYTRILRARVPNGNGIWLWEDDGENGPHSVNVALWLAIPLSIVFLIAWWHYIYVIEKYDAPKIAACKIHTTGVVFMALLATFFFIFWIVSISMDVPRSCKVTHRWIRGSGAGAREIVVCAEATKISPYLYSKKCYGCAATPISSLREVDAVLDYYVPGTPMTCYVNSNLPMNKMTSIAVTRDPLPMGYTGAWMQTIRAVPNSRVLWGFSMLTCGMLTILSLIALNQLEPPQYDEKDSLE